MIPPMIICSNLVIDLGLLIKYFQMKFIIVLLSCSAAPAYAFCAVGLLPSFYQGWFAQVF